MSVYSILKGYNEILHKNNLIKYNYGVENDLAISLFLHDFLLCKYEIMKRFDNANFIVGSSTVDFNWENPKMALIPEPLKQLLNPWWNSAPLTARPLSGLMMPA